MQPWAIQSDAVYRVDDSSYINGQNIAVDGGDRVRWIISHSPLTSPDPSAGLSASHPVNPGKIA